MPQVVKSLAAHYSNTGVGLLVMIPYLVALIGMVLISRSSDQRLERRYHTVVPMAVAGVTFLLLGTNTSLGLAILLWSLIATGILGAMGPFWSLPGAFLSGYAAAAGIALVNAIANVGGFVGPFMIGAINKQTGSFHGGLNLAGACILLSAILLLLLLRSPLSSHNCNSAATRL
jgi:ACS family tartrate transporter-like MFS transporter